MYADLIFYSNRLRNVYARWRSDISYCEERSQYAGVGDEESVEEVMD